MGRDPGSERGYAGETVSLRWLGRTFESTVEEMEGMAKEILASLIRLVAL